MPNRPSQRPAHDPAHTKSGPAKNGTAKDGLGGLVGAGPSKVGTQGAMRARDVARPSAQDLAEAERDLVIRHAAARIDSRPLPHGVAPAPPVPDRRPDAERRKKPRPTPHPPQQPPQRQASDQPPAPGEGSTPERS